MPSFESQILQHEKYLKAFALRLTNNYDDAQDLVQDTYLTAWRFANKFEEGSNMRAWLCTIMKNQFVNGYRSRKKESGRVDLEVEWLADKGPFVDPSIGEYEDELIGALESLPVNTRDVVVLTYAMDFTNQETSAITGITLGTIRSKLFNGRRKMRDYLKSKKL